MPSNDRFELLCKKFEDASNGDVNYPAFCQAIDEGNFFLENDFFFNKKKFNFNLKNKS